MKYSKGPTFNTEQVLQLSIIVDSQQGFIKSGYGYYDYENDVNVTDNKTTVMQYLSGDVSLPEFTDEVNTEASNIRNLWENSTVLKTVC
jgi:hypothetical protein